jgi:hypothetical protein
MRQSIETAPRERKTIIIEDGPTGTTDFAHWSPEKRSWVRENGEPSKITPTHWYPMPFDQAFAKDLPFSKEQPQAKDPPAARDQPFAKDQPVAKDQPAAKEEAGDFVDREDPNEFDLIEYPVSPPPRVGWVRRGFAAFAIVALVGAATGAGLYFTASEQRYAQLEDIYRNVARYFGQTGEEATRLDKKVETTIAEQRQERQKTAELTDDLATARSELEMTRLLSSKAAEEAAALKKTADTASAELQRERQRTAALTGELTTARRDLEAKTAVSSKAGDEAAQIKKTAEAASAELQQERQ